ncbi:MAG: translation initiation factor IF-2 [Spirochaetia bacterium]|nr:translation initiation factor IF-2 [Spirochaetia bacterium]
MAEEKLDNVPKTTLIKHSKKPVEVKQADSSNEVKPVEKKRVVVVKKKKVVVKKPAAAKTDTPPQTEQVSTEGELKHTEHSPTVTQVKDDTEKKAVTPQTSEPEAKPVSVPAPVSESEKPSGVKEPHKETDSDKPAKKEFSQKTFEKKSSAEIPPRSRTSQQIRDSFTKPRPTGTRAGVLRGKPVSGGLNTRNQDQRAGSGSPRPADPRSAPPRGYENRSPAQRPPTRDFRDSGTSQRPPGRYQPGNRPTQGTFQRNDTGGPGRPRPAGSRPPAGGGDAPAAPENQKTVKKVFKPKNKQQKNYQKKKEIYEEKNFQIKKKAAHKVNPVPKKIDIMEVITVSELAKKMNLKASELIGKLMGMGMMVTMNQQIDSETAQLLAEEYGCQVNVVSLYEETLIKTDEDSDELLIPRPPIVTVMGHVDHGKTKLLDAIRESDVVAGEFGGITQHIGAYEVHLPQGDIVFLDTPGHSAFTLMRARGAQVTDIVILVVAANDGVMPQTKEAIDHAKEAGVPIIVAINKIDLPEANPDRVKQQLSEYNLLPEDWGGTTLYCEISALKREGIDELLDSILLQAEMLELKANYNCRAEGKIVESKVDHGRGIVSTVIIERGTLRVGDPFVAGVYPGKVRAMFDDKGSKLDEATPSTPVEILGFTGIPSAGAPFQVTESDKISRQIGLKRQELERQGEASNVKKVTLDNLFDSIQDGEIQELKVIIKGDVHGSVEALQSSLEKLSTKEIRLVAIRASAGAIIEDDINLAAASNAIVIGFNVRPTPKAKLLADREKIDIRKYNIIYDAVDDIRSAMEGMLSPDIKEQIIGKVEVRDVIKVPKVGLIAGSYVLEGKVVRNSAVHILRDNIELYTGKITSLRRFKDDAKEVQEGYECGIGIDSYQDVRVGDILEIFERVEIAKKL